VFKLPTVEAMVTEDDWQQEITQAKWDATWNQIEHEMDQYADRVRMDLTRLVSLSRHLPILSTPDASPASRIPDAGASSDSPAVEAEGTDAAVLSAASTFFECKRCPSTSLFQYPAVLDHYHGWRAQWKLEDFTVGPATSIAESLLASRSRQDGGEDVNTVGRRLQCLRCDENASTPRDWSELVNHFKGEQQWYEGELHCQSTSLVKVPLHNDHALETDSSLFIVLSADAAHAQQAKVESWIAGEPWKWRCGLCQGTRRSQTKKAVALHLMKKHLKNSAEDGDIVNAPSRFFGAFS